MDQVDNTMLAAIIDEFFQAISSGEGSVRGGMSYATELLSKALGAGDTENALRRLREQTTMRPLDHLMVASGSIDVFLRMIQDEHPQTIALILTHIKEDRAAEMLSALSPEMRVEVIARIADMKAVSPEIISQIEDTLREKSEGQKRVTAGGVKVAAEILNRVDGDVEKQVMESIATSDPELADEISDLMFTYDNIVMITDQGIQTLVQETPENDLVMALKASTDAIKTKFFKNMSERRRQSIQEDLENMPPARLKDVLAAQKRIVALAKGMNQSGKIEIVREGEEVLV
jgi:flagellar motor switch protein FliG